MLISQKFLIFIVDSGAQLPTKFNRKGASTMKKLKKRLLAVALAALAAATMATPSFAASVTTSSKRHIYSINRSKYLNLEGNGCAYQNRDVTVANRTNDDDQNWKIMDAGNGLKVYTAKASCDGKVYALNANTSTANCNIYVDDKSNNDDSVVTTSGTNDSFTISLAGGQLAYFDLSVNPSNREVMWGSVTSYTWKLN